MLPKARTATKAMRAKDIGAAEAATKATKRGKSLPEGHGGSGAGARKPEPKTPKQKKCESNLHVHVSMYPGVYISCRGWQSHCHASWPLTAA